MTTRVERRELLRSLLTAFLGTVGGVGINIAGPADRQREHGVLEGIGRRRLHRDAAKLLDDFYHAEFGARTAYYQLFWPVAFYGTLERNYLNEITHASAGKEGAPEYFDKTHRIRVFPAIAHLHALAHVPTFGEEAEWHESKILEVHRSALDVAHYQNSQTLDIIWQNAITALIRSESSWKTYRLGVDILREAQKVCLLFINDDPTVIHAAVIAWQFLLSFDRALAERDANEDAQKLRHELQSVMAGILNIRGRPRGAWFRGLSKIYESRYSYNSMISQMGEVIIGRNHHPQDAVNFFMLVNLQANFHERLIAEDKLRSPYMNANAAVFAIDQQLKSYVDFGVGPAEWEAARLFAKNAGIPFTDEAEKHANEIFFDFGNRTKRLPIGDLHRNEIDEIAQHMPFRLANEEQLVRRLLGSAEFETVAGEAGRVTSGAAFMGLLHRVVDSAARDEAQRRNLRLDPAVSKTDAARVLFENLPEESYPVFDQYRREALDLLRTSVSLASPPNQEHAADSTNPTLTSAGHPADVGRNSLPPETSAMNTKMPDSPAIYDKLMELCNAGEEIYERLRDQLEANALYKFVRIDVESGEYVIGETTLNAMDRFTKKFGKIRSWGTQIGAW